MKTRELQIESIRNTLSKYIPQKTVGVVAEWIFHYQFHLRITQSRSTKLGDYSNPKAKGIHYITINHNLNQYAFFITLVHEVAHLVTYEQYKKNLGMIKPHGKEWKRNFKNLIWGFLNERVFPPEVLQVLKNYMDNPAASSCADADLQRVLKRYNKDSPFILLEDLPQDSLFKVNGRVFKKGVLLRKRFECIEMVSNKPYLVLATSEVLLITEKPILVLD